MNIAAIGVGSNIEATRSVARAKEALGREQTLLKESAFVVTSPIGLMAQPDFLNGAFLVATTLDRDAFANYLKKLEDRLGRVRTADKYGPRVIDLDIVVWNGSVLNKDFYERPFVKNAVLELLPGLCKGE
jgi:2-amino-4-hydroxy-6-hydroxymethyldihydropteridine diphosphokinase